jgi:hypothetical protein
VCVQLRVDDEELGQLSIGLRVSYPKTFHSEEKLVSSCFLISLQALSFLPHKGSKKYHSTKCRVHFFFFSENTSGGFPLRAPYFFHAACTPFPKE